MTWFRCGGGTDTSDATLSNASNLLTGNIAYGKDGVKYTGSMANKSGTTVSASTVSRDSSKVYITVPANGYYNTSSKLGIPHSTLEAVPNLDACMRVLIAKGWNNEGKLAQIVKLAVGGTVSYDMTGASTRVVGVSNSTHLGKLTSYGYADGTNYITQTNSGTTNTIKGTKRGAALVEIDYGSTCGAHLIIVI